MRRFLQRNIISAFALLLLSFSIAWAGEPSSSARIKYEIVDSNGQRLTAISKPGGTVTFGKAGEARYIFSGVGSTGGIELKAGRIGAGKTAQPEWLTHRSVLPKQRVSISLPGMSVAFDVLVDVVEAAPASPEQKAACLNKSGSAKIPAQCCIQCPSGVGACSDCMVLGECGTCCVGDCCG